MRRCHIHTSFVCMTAAGLALVASVSAQAASYARVTIVVGDQANEYEGRYAALLERRLSAMAAVEIGAGPATDGLTIYLGVAERHAALREACARYGVRLPQYIDPGAEGFVLRRLEGESGDLLIAAGSDSRGVLYAVGEILRQATGRGAAIELPDALDRREAPRFKYRGLSVAQGFTITELTGSRQWTEQEWQDALLDYALAGANLFELGLVSADNYQYRTVRDYGLMCLIDVNGNQGRGKDEWQAKEAIGRQGYLCPSIPEARAALLANCDTLFREMPFYDVVRYKSGDGGGCECERCAPYGGTFIQLCAEYTAILRRYHPETVVFAGNQKLDNAGDRAIFDYLQAEPRAWLAGIVYGPGSNAMGWMPGRRQDHRVDLFAYAGFGSYGGYLKEMLHQLPPQQGILMFSDLTHWVYSQYGLMDHELIADRNYATPPEWDRSMYEKRPDPNLARVYDRRTFHARPRNYYRAFQETMPFAMGECAYSEGHHDHLNQWMVQRLMWHPHASVEQVVGEYARTYFGPEAAAPMTRAIFQHEENLQMPIAENPGIDRVIEFLEEAGRVMAPQRMERDYLWRQYTQKAYLDKYIQLDVVRQREAVAKAEDLLRLALEEERDLAPALGEAHDALEAQGDTEAMAHLKAEAQRLGEESDRTYGVRSEGFFNLEQDYVGRGWLLREIERAQAAEGERAQEIVRRAVHYEDPGAGGFYDDAGDPDRSPHLVYGWPFGDGGFSGANKPSQQTAAFTTDETPGVTFAYRDLDPDAQYRVRFTLARPRYLPRFAMRQPQTRESIYADGIPLVKDLELPEYEADFFEYEVPPEATRDGALQIVFEKQAGVGVGPASEVTLWRNTGGWGTLVAEVWLLKMP